MTVSFEIKWPPIVPGEMFLRYKIIRLLTYSICYGTGKNVYIFSGWEERRNFLLGGFITGRNFHGEGSFQGLNFSEEIYTG